MQDSIIVDFDGTICIDDNVNRMLRLFLTLVSPIYSIVVLSYRMEDRRADTQHWLRKHHVPYTELVLQSGDRPGEYSPAIVKKRLYEQHIRGKYRTVLAIDDEYDVVAMFNSLDIQTWKVRA